MKHEMQNDVPKIKPQMAENTHVKFLFAGLASNMKATKLNAMKKT